MNGLTKRAQFLIDNLDLPDVSGVDTAKWEHFQIEHLCCDKPLRIENKSRQIAWSFLCSLEGTAEAILEGQSSFFVSINEDEASEKIRYARLIYENLSRHVSGLPKITINNQLALEFDNNARLLSLPSKAPRGKARFNVYLDEAAHLTHDREIYQGAMGVIAKGGRLRIGSSPFGAGGIFWEIFTESLSAYPDYVRKETPWWHCHGLCNNVKEAIAKAHLMTTEERVYQYGIDKIQLFYGNMDLADFQQEFECSFNDTNSSLIGFDEIKNCSDDNLVFFSATCYGENVNAAIKAIDDLFAANLETSFSAGVDIGRTRNTTEIFLIGLSSKIYPEKYPVRLTISLDNVSFDNQYYVLAYILSKLPIVKLKIDRNGLGMNLAENLEKKFSKAEGVQFTNSSKESWATNIKMLINQNKVILPNDRELAYQITSIKRIVTASKNLVFDTTKNEKHHADKFWALALALPITSGGFEKPTIKLVISRYSPSNLY